MVIGNLGGDPDLRFTASQTPVASFSVATTDVRINGDQKTEYTEWHRIVVWGKQAENCKKYLTKGSSVFVEGRIQTRSWDDKDGVKRYSTEIIAQNVRFLGSSRRDASQHADSQGSSHSFSGGNMYNSNSNSGDGQPSFGNSSLMDDGGFAGGSIPSLDQIPF
jgi:single-strand DNA-binding protein